MVFGVNGTDVDLTFLPAKFDGIVQDISDHNLYHDHIGIYNHTRKHIVNNIYLFDGCRWQMVIYFIEDHAPELKKGFVDAISFKLAS
ncbi:hypothetical protein D3C87_1364870 [compost metagenome]